MMRRDVRAALVFYLSLSLSAAAAGCGCESSESPVTTRPDSAAYSDASPYNDASSAAPSRPAGDGAHAQDAGTDSGSPPSAAGDAATRTDGATDAGDGKISDASDGSVSAPERIVTLRNGGFWTDVQGDRIEAHGGGFIAVEGSWYWIGEDKSHNAASFRAVNCYGSRDLVRWELRNAVVTRETAPQLDAADRIIERPKVIYNDRTRKYVMWLHWEGQNYATAEAGVFTSDTVCGDYAYRSSFRPNGNMSRDDTLFKDEDGTAYFVSAARENADLIIYELTDDYLAIERQVVTLWAGSYREAPALFKHAGRYYLVTSGATGWDPNQAKYASADTPEGPWSALRNLGNATTYDSQPSYVIPVAGTRGTTHILAADRWQDPDLAGSKYIWLPLKLDGTNLYLDTYDQWQLNLTTGQWSAEDGYLRQTEWKLLGASSEELQAEDGAAGRAFDNSPSTFWHTRYTGGEVPYPHELRIDLGAEYLLDGMRYMPRQDGKDNGNIARYTLYAALGPDNWGAPVSEGTFDAGAVPTKRSFPPARARYVRLVAQSEVKNRAWASVAELDLSGRSP